MSRSLYKLPYIHRALWAKSIKSRKNIIYCDKLKYKSIPYSSNLSTNLYFWNRNSLLNTKLAKTNKTIGIYNGYGFIVLHLKNRFSNYKLGEYSVSRRTPKHKGKQSQKKKVI